MAQGTAWTIRQIASLTGHEDRAWQVAWNPDLPLLASCSTDKTVRLYSYSTPAELAPGEEHNYRFATATTIPTGHTRTVRALSWAPGGKSLAVGSFDSTISIWERSTGGDSEDEGEDQPSGEWEMVSQLEGHENECKSVAYSHSGTLLASCSRDKSVWIWEVQPDAEFECLSVMMEHSQDVKAVTFHPREDILASASYDDTIKLYIDDPSDDWYPFATLKGHTSTVWSLAFSPCGRFLASSSDDKSIRIWRHVPADTGSRSPGDWRPALDWQAHSRSIYSISWGRKSANESEDVLGYIASAGGDGRIRIWRVSEAEAGLAYAEMSSLDKAHGDAEINCVSWCPRPNMYGILATAGDDGLVNVWKVSYGLVSYHSGVLLRHNPEALTNTLTLLSCKACYAEKQKCRPSTNAYAGCLPCQAKGIPCEPRKISTSKGTEPRIESVGEPSLLRLYESDLSSSKGATIHAPNFDDRGFEISRPRVHRRSGHRASRSAGAIASIDAIQAAASCSVVEQELLEPSEVVELYHLYMTRWNPCTLILDPSLHTLGYLSRSEFLLLVVLAVAAQEYPDRPEVYGELARYARKIGGKCLLNQAPNIDMVQAFLLLSLFPDWSTSFDENRSWLDLGLALDLAKQLKIDKRVETYDPENSPPSGPERNVFRTWMICHNLDAITTLVFDRPSSCVSIPDDCRRWPKDPDGSPEGIVGVLTTPLQDIDSHVKQKNLEKTLHGVTITSPIDEGATNPRLLDSQVIEKMTNDVSVASTFASNSRSGGGLIAFWLHLAHITTEYSRLLLLSQRPAADQGSNHSSEMLDSATAILQSYVSIFEDQSCAKYTPGYLFAYGALAVAVAHKACTTLLHWLIQNTDNDASRTTTTTLIKRFSEILRLSPTVTRNETESCIFVQIVDHVIRGEDTTPRVGRKSEPLSIQEPTVPMLTTVFPPWWRLYL